MTKFRRGTTAKPVVTAVDVDSAIDRILKEGAMKFRQEMMSLDGKAYVDRYMQLLEYIKPKLSRQEIKTDMQPTFNILFAPMQPKGSIGEGEQPVMLPQVSPAEIEPQNLPEEVPYAEED